MSVPSNHPDAPPVQAPSTRSSALRRWLPLAVLAGLMMLAFAMGWHKHLSLKTVALNYDALRAYVADHLAVSLLAFMAAYIAVVALSLPGGLAMTLSGSLLLGWKLAAPAIVVAATIGATIVFLVARSALGSSLAARAGPAVAKLRDGFNDNALSYLLFLRLVPAFPFFIVNLVPALLGVPLTTYVLGTFFGIIPAVVAFSVLGSGLGSVVEAQNAHYKACVAANPVNPDAACVYKIDTGALVTGELLAAFGLLGIVALIPVFYKKWSKRHAPR